MVVSRRFLWISFVLLVVSDSLVYANVKKPAAAADGVALVDVVEGEDPVVEKSEKKKLEVGEVTYDGRSVMINGKHEIFFSGSIHYPRSTVDVSFLILSSIFIFAQRRLVKLKAGRMYVTLSRVQE